jgi:hypothetical protein
MHINSEQIFLFFSATLIVYSFLLQGNFRLSYEKICYVCESHEESGGG